MPEVKSPGNGPVLASVVRTLRDQGELGVSFLVAEEKRYSKGRDYDLNVEASLRIARRRAEDLVEALEDLMVQVHMRNLERKKRETR